VIAPLAKFIDWCVLQAVPLGISPRKCDKNNTKLTEAIEFLNGPNFIPADSKPAELEFTSDIHFKFPSPKPCEFAENNVVHGRLYRRAKDWQKFPTLILLHGSLDFFNHRYRFPLMVPAIHRAGFNAATLAAPYHFQRRVRRKFAWDHLQSAELVEFALDHLRSAEALGQAVAEIRALTGWLLDQGCPSVALLGISLGGWLAGLTATRDSRLKAIILVAPRVRSNYGVMRGERVLWTPVRKALERRKAALEAWDKTPTNLTLSQPVIPKENILFIQGRYDLLAMPEYTEELWQKWKQPEIWRLPHGHISLVGVPGLTGRVLRWLSPRLNKSTAEEKNFSAPLR
jgi:pimeloyl-ACP methyl ester carboxylesterase